MSNLVQYIELDCHPFSQRPSYFLPAVLEHTGIVPVDESSTMFGCWLFSYAHISSEEWKQALPRIETNIKKLYSQGSIRYGSWK